MGRPVVNEGAALTLAVVAHLLVLGVAPRLIPPAALVGDGERPLISTEFDVELAPAPAPAPPAPATPVDEAEPDEIAAPAPQRAPSHAKTTALPKEAPAASPRAEASADEARPEAPAVPAAPPAPAPPSPGPTDGYSEPPPPSGPVTGLPPGIGGAPVWSVPGVLGPADTAGPAAAPTTAGPARPVDRDVAGQVLRGTLAKKDHELGLALPAAGVVASTLADAVRSSAAPADARATFEVQIGANGQVRDVRLVSSSAGNATTWQRVTRDATSALGAKALSMTGDAANGATVIVKVESKEQYAAGNKKKIDVKPVCANEVIEEVALALQPLVSGPGGGPGADPGAAAAAAQRQPGSIAGRRADDDERRRFCIPIGVAGVGDASNIGTHLQKVVRSTYQVVLPGAKKIQADEAKPVDVRAPWLEKRDDTSDRVFKKWKPKKKKKKKAPGETETAR